KTPLARGVENGDQTALRWPENLARGGIFAEPLRLRLTSKRAETSDISFIFESSSMQAVHGPRWVMVVV
ncbi:hypothetical protein PanWU01x14_082710, partial [Parasponia andersonii]